MPALPSANVVKASVTPLSSIFGSGFLIIVPVLERTLGALSVVGIAAVCGLAWLIGIAIRHNVATAEPLADNGRLDTATRRIDQAADAVIVLAYVISVALYLRIMAQYVIDLSGSGSATAERGLASAAIVIIVAVGVVRGFAGLDLMERIALGAVLVLVTILGATLLGSDAIDLAGGGLDLPPVPGRSLSDILRVLGGIVITVQGFETVRFLADEFDRDTRIRACRNSQLISTSIYIGFVLVATPAMGLGTGDGADMSLLDVTGRVAALLSVPLVVTAVLSQFSAAVADTVAADGNLRMLTPLAGPAAFMVTGAAAVLLLWTLSTFAIIALASRAFAAYYALQCVVALRTSSGRRQRLGYGTLALVLVAVTVLAKPAG